MSGVDDVYKQDKQNQQSNHIQGAEDEQKPYELNMNLEMQEQFCNNDTQQDQMKTSAKKRLGQVYSIKRQQSQSNSEQCQLSPDDLSPCNAQLNASSTQCSTQSYTQNSNCSPSQGTNPNNYLHNVSYLSRVRVIKKNLVYVIGIAPQLANEQTLQSYQYFGQYGEIQKLVVNKNNIYNPKGPNGPSFSAYITYAEEKEASLSILGTENFKIFDRIIRASYGTTKYCSYFLKNQDCPNIPDCLYLHSYGKDDDYFSKDEMVSNKNIFIDQQKIAIKNIRKYIPEILLEYQQKKNYFETQSHYFALPNLTRILEKLKDYGAITMDQYYSCRESPSCMQMNPHSGIYLQYPSRHVSYNLPHGQQYGIQPIFFGNEYENNSNSYAIAQQENNQIPYPPQGDIQQVYMDPSQYHQQQMFFTQQRIGQYYQPHQYPLERVSNIPMYQQNQANQSLPPPTNSYYYHQQQGMYCYSPYSPVNQKPYQQMRNKSSCDYINPQQFSCPSYGQVNQITPFEVNDQRYQVPQEFQGGNYFNSQIKINKNQYENDGIIQRTQVQQQPLNSTANSALFNSETPQNLKLSKHSSMNNSKDSENNEKSISKQKTAEYQQSQEYLEQEITNQQVEKYENNLKDQVTAQEKKTDINNCEYSNFLQETVKSNSQQIQIQQIDNKQSEIETDVHNYHITETYKDQNDNQSTTSYESGIPTKSISAESEKIDDDVFQPMYFKQKSSKIIQNLITELSSKSSSSLKSSDTFEKQVCDENSKDQEESNTPIKLKNSGYQMPGEVSCHSNKFESGNKITNQNYELIANFWEEQNSKFQSSINPNQSKPIPQIQQSSENNQNSETEHSEQKNSDTKLFYTYESDQNSFQELCSGFNTFVLTKYH